MKTRRGGLRLRRSSSPRRARTLVALLERDISRDVGTGPDWYLEVSVACERQDMEWELDVWRDAVIHRETGPVLAGPHPR